MLAFIYDCMPRERENGKQENDCMMGIPTETTRDDGGDARSLSQSAESIWYAAMRPLLFNTEPLEQATTNTGFTRREALSGVCVDVSDKNLITPRSRTAIDSGCLFCLAVHAQSTVTIMDAHSMRAGHIKGRINSSETLITTLLLLCTFALYTTLQ